MQVLVHAAAFALDAVICRRRRGRPLLGHLPICRHMHMCRTAFPIAGMCRSCHGASLCS